MIRRDMPAVIGIENACFEFAWNEDDFIRCLRQRNCIGMVAEEEDKVVGFMIYELHKNRLHILNFAVHPDHRRVGIGKLPAIGKGIRRDIQDPHDYRFRAKRKRLAVGQFYHAF